MSRALQDEPDKTNKSHSVITQFPCCNLNKLCSVPQESAEGIAFDALHDLDAANQKSEAILHTSEDLTKPNSTSDIMTYIFVTYSRKKYC